MVRAGGVIRAICIWALCALTWPLTARAQEDIVETAPADDPTAPAAQAHEMPGPKKAPRRYARAVKIRLFGPLDDYTWFTFQRRLADAQALKPDLLVIEIDSPGGRLDVSEQIADVLRELGWARTVAYVRNMALSGGAVCALACDEIVMHPRARMGDVGALERMEADAFRYAPEKIVSDIVVYIRKLAADKGRPPTLVEAMVRKELKVLRVRNPRNGQVEYLSELELKARGNERLEVLDTVAETEKGLFLEVTGERAVELSLADAVVADEAALMARYGSEGDCEVLHETWVDGVVWWLNFPLITFLLFAVGLVGLYLELSSPGTGVGAVLALCSFGLFFWSHYMEGSANVIEILMFVVGAALLAMEFFIFPGFGIAGFTGGLLMLASLILASQRVVIPQTVYEIATLRNSILTLVASGGVAATVAYFLRKHMAQAKFLGGLVLTPPEPDKLPADAAESTASATPANLLAGPASLVVGQRGAATTPLRPAGKVRLGERLIDVVAADGDFIQPGERVEIVSIHGSRVEVRRVEG